MKAKGLIGLLLLAAVWLLYLVPTAAVLDVGYGTEGFRRYSPGYAGVRVLGAAREADSRLRVTVLAALPPGTAVHCVTERGKLLPVQGEVASEVEARQEWLFLLPAEDHPASLVVQMGDEQYRWSLRPPVQFQSYPWWFRIAPPWAKRQHARHVGLGLQGR